MSLPSMASGFAFFVSLLKTELILSSFVLKSQASVWTSSKSLKKASPFAKKTDNIFRKLGINFIPVVPPFLINSPRAVVISCSILFFVSSSVFFILFIIVVKVFVVSPSSKKKNISQYCRLELWYRFLFSFRLWWEMVKNCSYYMTQPTVQCTLYTRYK